MRIPFGRPCINGEEVAAVLEVLKRSELTDAGENAAFEEEFAAWIGGGIAIAVSSCMAALHLSWLAFGVVRGSHILVPALTHVATAHAVELCGYKPRFVDVEPKTGNIDCEHAEVSIRRDPAAGLAPVHYLGRPADMMRLRQLATQFNIKIVEDCALSLGAWFGNVHTGLMGDCGCFSFYPVKHITTGEGGMFVTRNSELADKVRAMRAFGKHEGQFRYIGMNYRMSELQAAIGRVQLRKARDFLMRRARNYVLLSNALKDFEIVESTPGSCYALCVMLPRDVDRDRVRNMMAKRQVWTSVYYPVVPLLPYYRQKYGYKSGMFPVAEKFAMHSICLPVGPHLSSEQIEFLAQTFKETVQQCV